MKCGSAWKEEILLWLNWSGLLKWWGGNLEDRWASVSSSVIQREEWISLHRDSGRINEILHGKFLPLGAGRGGCQKVGDDVGVTVSLLHLHPETHLARTHTHLSGYRDLHRQLFRLFINQRLLRPYCIVRPYPRPCEYSKQKNHTRPSRIPLPTGGDKYINWREKMTSDSDKCYL